MSSLPLSLGAHVDFSLLPRDRVFHQASAWCPLSSSSSVFVIYVLSSSSFGLEFIAADPPALQQFNLALRRWCCHLPLFAAVHWELGNGDALHFALGALSRSSGACVLSTMPLLALRSLPVCSGSPRLCKVHGHTSACLLSTLSPSAPCRRGYLSWLSALVNTPTVLPRSLSSSAPRSSSQTLPWGI